MTAASGLKIDQPGMPGGINQQVVLVEVTVRRAGIGRTHERRTCHAQQGIGKGTIILQRFEIQLLPALHKILQFRERIFQFL